MLPYNAETSGVFLHTWIERINRELPAVPEVHTGLVFDVGAFDGDSLPLYRALGGKEFFCFEPDPVNFAALQKQTGLMSDVTRFPLAFSDKAGTMQMTRCEQQPLFSTLEPTWGDVARHVQAFRGPKTTATVRTITLNEFIDQSRLIPEYLKLDVEGHELAVLEGLNYKPRHCIFEWVVERPESAAACLGRLRMLGFKRFGIGIEERPPLPDNSNFDFQGAIRRLIYLRCCVPSAQWGNIWCE